ncbi:MAG: hypothetical protein Q9184_004823, partial [Pyrenodesmia sp. 2 TL-2023]
MPLLEGDIVGFRNQTCGCLLFLLFDEVEVVPKTQIFPNRLQVENPLFVTLQTLRLVLSSFLSNPSPLPLLPASSISADF